MGESLGETLAEQTWKKNKQSTKARFLHIFNKDKFEHTSALFKSSKILNVYKLNIFNTAVFYR